MVIKLEPNPFWPGSNLGSFELKFKLRGAGPKTNWKLSLVGGLGHKNKLKIEPLAGKMGHKKIAAIFSDISTIFLRFFSVAFVRHPMLDFFVDISPLKWYIIDITKHFWKFPPIDNRFPLLCRISSLFNISVTFHK